MQGIKRRLLHATLFEIIALALVIPAVALIFRSSMGHAGALAVGLSLAAMFWNMIYNDLYERWEARQASRERTVQRRLWHAAGFEGGLVLITVPAVAWWMQLSLWQALLADMGFVLFYLLYALAFNWGFDRLFGLPASAQASTA